MTASEYIKAKGVKSLALVARKVGRTPQTINNWYKDDFALLEIVVLGCLAKQQGEDND